MGISKVFAKKVAFKVRFERGVNFSKVKIETVYSSFKEQVYRPRGKRQYLVLKEDERSLEVA